jgi:diguanylate cyclase (GGDEF)-like protein/PAS domain S-box-containing protein
MKTSHAQEKIIHNLLETLHEVLWAFTPDFKTLLYVNPAVEEVFGYTAEQLYAQSDLWIRCVHPDDQILVTQLMQESWRNSDEVSYRIVRPDGQMRWLRSRAHMIYDSDGKPLSVNGITFDISERKKAENALQKLAENEREENRIAQILREIATILSQDLNYDLVLDHLLKQVARIVPFDGACVMLVRNERAYVARYLGYDQPGYEDSRLLIGGRSFAISTTPNLHYMFESQQAMAIPDTRAFSDWVQVEKFEYRSWVGAPFVHEGQVDAFLSLDKLEPNFYGPIHAQRLSLFAKQASLALSNAKLFAETLEALEHEQKLGEITRAISSELDLPVVLQQVVRLAVELAGAEAGTMSLLDDEMQALRYLYIYNLPAELKSLIVKNGEGVVWDVIYKRQPLLLNHYAAAPHADPRWAATGVQSIIIVPVVVGNACLGALTVASYNAEYSFEARDCDLVEMVGRQAGIAIQNARLFESIARRANEAETLRQAAADVNSALDLDKVLEKILERLDSVIPYDSASIFLFEEDHMRMKAGRGLPNLTELLARWYATNNPLFQAIEKARSAIILEDAQDDPRFERWGDATYIHGWIGLPLRVRYENIGYLIIDSQQVGAYRQTDADLAQAFADEVAIAIENARLFQQVQQLAITDPLTGLYNRRYFTEAANREFDRAQRYHDPLSIIMIDLDRFKQVNDTYGHLAGDRALISVANRCQQSLRDVDILARLGGEEFIVLLPQTTLEGAYLVAERLHDHIMTQAVDAGSQKIFVSASMGIATLSENCLDLQTLIDRADRALYVTKNAGRGAISVWSED